MDPLRSRFATMEKSAGQGGAAAANAKAASSRPILPAGIREAFLPIVERVPDGYQLEYRPGLVGSGKVHFTRAADGIDVWRECHLLQTLCETPPDDIWGQAQVFSERLASEALPDETGTFAELPSELARDKSYAVFGRQLEEHLYREMTLELMRCELVDRCSKPDEQERDFRQRLEPLTNERREAERQRIEQVAAGQLAKFDGWIKSAEARVAAQKWQFWTRASGFLWILVETAFRFMGHGRAGRPRSPEVAMRGMATERGQQASAQASLDKLLGDRHSLESNRDAALAELDGKFKSDQVPLERIELKPRKTDIEIDGVVLTWLPYRVDARGAAEAVYRTPASDANFGDGGSDEPVGQVS